MTELILLVGLPGSGKSYWAEQHKDEYNATILSSDQYRKNLYGSEEILGNNDKLFGQIYNDAIELLKDNKNIILDSTCLTYKKRKGFLDKIKNLDVNKTCILFSVPLKDCLERNKNRERHVPEKIIERMANMFDVPLWTEGWNQIELVFNGNMLDYHVEDYLNFADTYDQKNHNHTLTLGLHSRKVANYVREFKVDSHVYYASLLHDCGKPLTQVFVNSKGEPSSNAHYYNHHNRGAYEVLFYGYNLGYSDKEILFMSALVNYHMRLYFCDSEKSKNKLFNTVGEDLMYFLNILHEGDKKSK